MIYLLKTTPVTSNININNLLYELTKEFSIQNNKFNNINYELTKESSNSNIRINNLLYEPSKESISSNTKINSLLYDISKESISDTISINNLSHIISKQAVNNNISINSLYHELSKESINDNTNLKNLLHELSKESINSEIDTTLNYVYTPEIVNFNISSSINYVYSPEIINFNVKTSLTNEYNVEISRLNVKPEVNYSLYKQLGNFNLNLNGLTYNLLDIKKTVNQSISASINTFYEPENTVTSRSLSKTDLYSVVTDQATASKISFVPYDSSSNLTFNSSSLRRYVNQTNEVFYMSGSQLTSSRINYQEDVELIVIGKGSTTTYKDNLDYNLPYRASFIVKNWPHYQYNTSSYWHLPVPLNASNDDILASGDIWITASFQNGTDVFTDQYGFAIDI